MEVHAGPTGRSSHPSGAAAPLPATGERTAPGLPDEEYWFSRHEAAYAWIADRWSTTIADGIVADAGAGEGYGTAWLDAPRPRLVVAWEYDDAACAHAAATYPTCSVARANLDALPARDDSVDLIASCQVIEHLWDLPRFLGECHRTLRSGGVLIVTTPNRLTFSPDLGRHEKPVNPFHVEEFDAEQVDGALRTAGFADIEVVGLHHGPRVTAWEQHNGSIVAAQVKAVLAGTWTDDLRHFVGSITRDDFFVGPASDAAADLIGIGRVP